MRAILTPMKKQKRKQIAKKKTQGKTKRKTKTEWKTYEAVARHLLGEIGEQLGVDRFEGDKKLSGESGTTWNVEGKGVRESDDTFFLILECKRYTTSKVKQEQIGGLAYRILDTGAAGAIVVSPAEFQEGAKKVAAHKGIVSVRLDENSTTLDYVLKFLNQIRVGVSDKVGISDGRETIVLREVGKEPGKEKA